MSVARFNRFYVLVLVEGEIVEVKNLLRIQKNLDLFFTESGLVFGVASAKDYFSSVCGHKDRMIKTGRN